MMAKNIASKETNIVRRVKGKGSKTGICGTFPVFIRIQPTKKRILTIKKRILPKDEVRESAILILRGRFLKAFASKLSIKKWVLSLVWDIG